MHAIQGAMAVRRERQKRQQRRLSKQQHQTGKRSSSPMPPQTPETPAVDLTPPKAEGSLTAFHLGVVFILLGFLLVFSSMVQADWSSRLLGVGTTLILVGLIMVMVNRIITQREEEELAKYVRHRLARTRSGHAISSDPEDGLQYQKSSAKRQRRRMRLLGRNKKKDPEDEETRAPDAQNGKVPCVKVTSASEVAAEVAAAAAAASEEGTIAIVEGLENDNTRSQSNGEATADESREDRRLLEGSTNEEANNT